MAYLKARLYNCYKGREYVKIVVPASVKAGPVKLRIKNFGEVEAFLTRHSDGWLQAKFIINGLKPGDIIDVEICHQSKNPCKPRISEPLRCIKCRRFVRSVDRNGLCTRCWYEDEMEALVRWPL